MKNFTQSNWIQSLDETEWEKLGETEDVNTMAECFNANVTKALDICAPLKITPNINLDFQKILRMLLSKKYQRGAKWARGANGGNGDNTCRDQQVIRK